MREKASSEFLFKLWKQELNEYFEEQKLKFLVETNSEFVKFLANSHIKDVYLNNEQTEAPEIIITLIDGDKKLTYEVNDLSVSASYESPTNEEELDFDSLEQYFIDISFDRIFIQNTYAKNYPSEFQTFMQYINEPISNVHYIDIHYERAIEFHVNEEIYVVIPDDYKDEIMKHELECKVLSNYICFDKPIINFNKCSIYQGEIII